MSVTLCITAFNEQENLPDLIDDLTWLHARQSKMKVLLVDNGSTDNTWGMLQDLANEHGNWLSIIQLDENLGYGGGLRTAVTGAVTETVALLSADRQYPIQDVLMAIEAFESASKATDAQVLLVGDRHKRFDPMSAKFVSWFYSRTVRFVLGTKAVDVNGQPKIFHRDLVIDSEIPWSDSFFFDAQLIAVAQRRDITVVSAPVTFVNRRYGKSSWSGQRLKVYRSTLIEMWKFRKYLDGMNQ